MKHSILTDDPIRFEKSLRSRITLAIVLTAATLCLNVLLTILRTDENHTYMLIANIALDILCGLFLLPFITLRILPQRKLLKLTQRGKETVQATVLALSDNSQRYMDMDCLTVSTENRTLFLPIHTIRLQTGTAYRFMLVQNIIVEAEQ